MNGPCAAAALALLACSCSTNLENTPAHNRIVFSPAKTGSFAAINVDITFRSKADGETRILFPDRWGPEENLGALVQDVAVFHSQSGAPVPTSREGSALVLQSEPNTALTLHYVLTQDYEGEPRWGVQRVPGMRPILQPDYATIIGHTALPDIDDAAYAVLLKGFPAGGAAAFSLRADASGHTAPAPLADIKDSIFTFGDFRYAERKRGDLLLRTSIRGAWALSDSEIEETARSVVANASLMFGDAPFTQYFVALNAQPRLPSGSSVIGSSFTQSFFVLATENADSSNLEHTIVHEILHEWITRRMGATDESTDPQRMWFIEGFTEYFTQIILLKSGLISLDGFLEGMNGLAAGYQTSPVRALPASDLQDRLWDSHETERLPYQRGALLAFEWDARARENGGALADAITMLLDAGEAQRAAGAAPLLTDDAIMTAVSAAAGADFESLYKRNIESGEVIDFARYKTPACIELTAGADHIFRFRRKASANDGACIAEIVGR